jgi:glycosyltransferase involved in cell wall biosynthesis
MSDPVPVRILVIGPMPPPYTGTTTLLEYLVDILSARPEVQLNVINTLGVRGAGLLGPLRFLQLVARAIRAARASDIVTLHCSTTGLHVIGPAAYAVARLTGKPLLVRKFAGDDYQTTLGPVGRALARFVLRRADRYLAESHQLVASAEKDGITRTGWYPNSRPIPDAQPDFSQKSSVCSRYVYIGRVIEGKGMRVLAEASRTLPASISIDVYGPWGNDLEPDLFESCPNITWHGPLKPEAIVPTMAKYDASLLPTHYQGEGYPGAILESYLAGLPVIVTRWQALPEIVDETVGIFIEPRNASDLANAMIALHENPEHFQRLRRNTREKAEFFSAARWAEEFLRVCREITGRQEEHP